MKTNRKSFRRPISFILILCLLMSMLSIATVSAGAQTVTYISDVKTGCASTLNEAKKILTDQGYTVIHHDMNNKVPNQNRWIYVGYKTTTNINEAITGLIFSNENKNTIYYNEKTYTIEGGRSDFNAGAGGEYIYLYYTKEKDASYTTEYLTALDAVASTDDYGLRGQNFKAVGSVNNNYAQNVNAGVSRAKPSYLVYNSVLDSNAYKKQGVNELAKTVKSANGVTYYDAGDTTASTEYLKTALSAEYNGTSQVELWADMLYSMLEIKGQGNGYRNDTGKSFDTMYGKGEYLDIVSALKTGTGNYNSNFSNLFVQSTGLQSAKNPSQVYDEVIKMFTTLHHGEVGVGCSDYSYSNIDSEVVDLDGLKNTTSSSDVLYSICRVADDNRNGSQSKGHDKSTSVFGLMFYNFKFVPIVEEANTGRSLLNYAEDNTIINSTKTSTQVVVNDTESAVSSTKTYAGTTAKSISNTMSSTCGKNIGFTQGVSTNVGSGDLLPFSAGVSVSLGYSQAFDFSETNSTGNMLSKDISVSDSVSMNIPAYSVATLQCDSFSLTQSKAYDCPLALTYDVALFSTSAELGKENMWYTSFAYNSSLFATFGNESLTAVEALNNIVKTNGTDTNGFSVACIGCDSHDTAFTSYSTSDWNAIINNNVASGEYPISSIDAMKRIIKNQPMSFNGGKISAEVDSVCYAATNRYSLYPIDKIKVFKTNFASEAQTYVSEIKMNEQKEYRLQDYYNSITASTKYNTDFTNWDMSQGYWVLVKEDGTEIPITSDEVISDGIISVRMDRTVGNIYMTPLKNGSSYVRYKINETGYFQYYDYAQSGSTTFNSANVKNCTNDMISSKGTIEIVVSNIE